MTWQSNLFNNLLTVTILLALFTLIYCKLTHNTIKDIIQEVKEG
jgi:hypothetical protein